MVWNGRANDINIKYHCEHVRIAGEVNSLALTPKPFLGMYLRTTFEWNKFHGRMMISYKEIQFETFFFWFGLVWFGFDFDLNAF